jgi:hypothetical protein
MIYIKFIIINLSLVFNVVAGDKKRKIRKGEKKS